MPRDLKKLLDSLYASYDFEARRAHDPISFPHAYPRKADKEVAGFIASCYAYGSVKLFMPVIGRILGPMGKSPADFLGSFDPRRDAGMFSGISYRFYKDSDLLRLLAAISRAIREHGSLEALFMRGMDESAPNVGPALAAFMLRMREAATKASRGGRHGYEFYFPTPANGGACKRGCLFLRWMVRDSDIDFGLWKGVPKDRLVIPLDTHIARIARCLGLTARKSDDWKTAEQITESLRALDPSDPLKYDFALCHRGISGECDKSKCASCAIWSGYT